MSTAEIRPMETGDLDAVAELEAENFSVPWGREDFRRYLGGTCGCFLAAGNQNALSGYIGAIYTETEADITNVSVRKTCEGKGIGTALIEALQTKLKQKGIRRIFLEVRKSNGRAIRLYQKKGFRPVGERKRYYSRPDEDAIVMMCELQSG